ncbi:hypothetical protein [Polyangium jinanense]|uniref:Uncharacterized protein n=1 Tax=Polyangium jinanense TaxID=2829994 RepID=A0A9X3X1S4_9BACT|nr:hypothetical protein [Polyangium jinanense]MDC3952287.1 hypothetical protein [Polyangium jinanense]MDC3956432.1 hypothetical protein [Polyangium jinanense]MDC3979916.1 hypothetical protein [Polyangium jinanense]MDC3982569.1 hypothetical protein [Polyangium jinanense]
MSAAHDAHGDHAAGHHASHDHDHFDNDPVQELPADEPRTPTWIPIVGLLLFFFAGTAWLLAGSGDEAQPKTDSAPAQVAPQAAPQPQALQPQAQPARLPPAAPQARPTPAPLGSGGLRQLTPDQAKQIQQQIEALRARQQQPGGAPQPQPAPPVPR